MWPISVISVIFSPLRKNPRHDKTETAALEACHHVAPHSQIDTPASIAFDRPYIRPLWSVFVFAIYIIAQIHFLPWHVQENAHMSRVPSISSSLCLLLVSYQTHNNVVQITTSSRSKQSLQFLSQQSHWKQARSPIDGELLEPTNFFNGLLFSTLPFFIPNPFTHKNNDRGIPLRVDTVNYFFIHFYDSLLYSLRIPWINLNAQKTGEKIKIRWTNQFNSLSPRQHFTFVFSFFSTITIQIPKTEN